MPDSATSSPRTFLSQRWSSWRSDLCEALRGSQRDLTEEPLRRALLLLAVPMVLEMSSYAVLALCDAYFVARLGPAAVAGVGLTHSLLPVVFAIAQGLGIGTAAMVARRIGAKDTEGAAVTTVQAATLGLAVGLGIGIVGALTVTDLMRFMGAGEDVVETSGTYARLLFGGSGILQMLILFNAALRSSGAPSLALRTLLIVDLTNLVLDPILIFGLGGVPAMGVTGAAVATVAGQSLGLAYQLRLLSRGRGRFRLERRHLKVVPELMARLVRLSGVAMLQYTVSFLGFAALVWVITPFTPAALAGYTLASRVISFATFPVWGMAGAAATLVGQNLGAHNPDRAERSAWTAAHYSTAYLATFGLLFILAARPAISFFTADAAIVEYGSQCLRTISFGFALTGYGMVISSAFNGSGDPATPTWINLGCSWCLKLPLAWLLSWPLGWGPMGAFVAILVGDITAAAAAILLFRRGHWKRKVV